MGNNIMDWLYHKVMSTAGLCTPNLEHLADYLEKAEQYTERAKTVSSFAAASAEMPGKLQKASEALGSLNAYVKRGATGAGDIGAACEISQALAVLNKWAADPKPNNAQAAAAFDKLFGGVARFAAKLPPPVNQYSRIFEQIALSQFFSGMQKLGASRTGDNTSTPTGRQMKEVWDSME